MAKKSKVKFHVPQFKAMSQDRRVRAELLARGKKIAAAAGGEVKGYIVRENLARDARAGVTVMATGHAARSNRKHQSLLKALAAGGGR